MKNTPERIYLVNSSEELITNHEKEFDDDIEYICFSKVAELMAVSYQNGVDDAKENLFTKEQVIELMREAWIGSIKNRHFFEDDHFAYFYQWLEQEKLLDSK